MKKLILTGLAATGLFLSSCSASSTDFKTTAEKVIKDFFNKEVTGAATATCDKPSSTSVGTTFTCTATDGSGQAYNITAKITKKNEVTIIDATPVGATGDTTGGSTVDTSGATATTTATT